MTDMERKLYNEYVDRCGDFRRNPCLETEQPAFEAYKELIKESNKQEIMDFRIAQCWSKHIVSGYDNQCLWEA